MWPKVSLNVQHILHKSNMLVLIQNRGHIALFLRHSVAMVWTPGPTKHRIESG